MDLDNRFCIGERDSPFWIITIVRSIISSPLTLCVLWCMVSLSLFSHTAEPYGVRFERKGRTALPSLSWMPSGFLLTPLPQYKVGIGWNWTNFGTPSSFEPLDNSTTEYWWVALATYRGVTLNEPSHTVFLSVITPIVFPPLFTHTIPYFLKNVLFGS